MELVGPLLRGPGSDFSTFLADSGGNLAFRSLKWRCWADSCVIMLLPTRVGEKKSQVNASGEPACRHPAPEATPGPWNRWKTDCWWAVSGEACLRGRSQSGDFTSVGSALLAPDSPGLYVLSNRTWMDGETFLLMLRSVTKKTPAQFFWGTDKYFPNIKCEHMNILGMLATTVWIVRSEALTDS